MYSTLTTLIDRLDSSAVSGTDVIRWGSPVPSFGDLSNAAVATLGLNPSNREFVDESGDELEGVSRRFHTLRSLGLSSWEEVDARHLHMIIESCRSYFQGNPYDTWFKKLDQVISGTNASYYSSTSCACHLDLIPYATSRKWTELSPQQRSSLLGSAGDTLGLLLRDSPVRILILNGRSVVEQFQDIAGVCLETEVMPTWSLPRQARPDVRGVSYRGVIDTLSGIALGRDVLVLGFNHNIQSSFGVTTEVIRAIRSWITQSVEEVSQ
jgi:hypothetical protein